MKTRDIIVVGASAGGVPALVDFVKVLPKDFPGSVFVVLHIPAHSQTALPSILSKAGSLPAVLAQDNMEVQAGMIYVAPNNHHMILDGNNIKIKKGPKENRFRPSIDALFRSAAYVYGTRVIAVILSGILDDGVSGMWTVKELGGITMVQHPEDAAQGQLPLNVMEYVKPDYVVPVEDMGPLLSGITKKRVQRQRPIRPEKLKLLETEIMIASEADGFELGIMRMGVLTPFTCPACHGVLVRLKEANLIRYRCHTGHAFTSSTLLGEVSDSIENIMWAAMRGMEEMVMLLESVSEHFKITKDKKAENSFLERAQAYKARSVAIHELIMEGQENSEDLRPN